MMGLARHRHALPALAVISFLDSSIFPIPPDIMLIPRVLADRRRAWWIALVCTVSSVFGGFAGYAVGYFLFETIGRAVIEFYRLADQFDAFQQAFLEYGWWIIVIKGATPIP